jgi:hypothetical protein
MIDFPEPPSPPYSRIFGTHYDERPGEVEAHLTRRGLMFSLTLVSSLRSNENELPFHGAAV